MIRAIQVESLSQLGRYHGKISISQPNSVSSLFYKNYVSTRSGKDSSKLQEWVNLNSKDSREIFFIRDAFIISWRWNINDSKNILLVKNGADYMFLSEEPWTSAFTPIFERVENNIYNINVPNDVEQLEASDCNEVVYIGGNLNFSHMLCQYLPLLPVLKNSGIFSDPLFIIEAQTNSIHSLLNSLQRSFKLSYFSSSNSNIFKPVIHRLRDFYFLNAFQPHEGYHLVDDLLSNQDLGLDNNPEDDIDCSIYISRKPHMSRIRDNQMLEAYLKHEHNFRIIYAEDYSIIEIRKILEKAKKVLLQQGSGGVHAYTNSLLFSKCLANKARVVSLNSFDPNSSLNNIQESSVMTWILPGFYTKAYSYITSNESKMGESSFAGFHSYNINEILDALKF